MDDIVRMPKKELERLQERARKLALEKSYLQLVNDLMNSLSSMPGLDNTVDRIIRLILDNIGGVNVAVYYVMDTQIHYADVFGEKKVLASVDDAMVRSVLETGTIAEETKDFGETMRMTPEFTKASSWAFPLVVGEHMVGVLKMDGMLMAVGEVRTQLQPFFNYAALVLKNEMESSSKIKEAYTQLQITNKDLKGTEEALRNSYGELEARVAVRTADLREANAQLRIQLVERKKAEEAARANEERFRQVFENSPVSIWEEDLSVVKDTLDALRAQGIDDLDAYFNEHPETARLCAEAVKIIDVNRAALALHRAANKEVLLAGLADRFTPESYDTFRKELTTLWLGGREMECDSVVRTLNGEIRHVTVYFAICPGYEKTLARVFVSLVDITERRRADEALHRLNRELRAVSDCNQTLMRAEDEQSLLKDICRIVCDEAGYRMAWVGYAENDDARTIRPVACAGVVDGYLDQAQLTWADVPRGRGPSGTAVRSGVSSCIQDFTTDPKAAPWRDSALQRGYRSSISLPLKNETSVTFGVLNIYSNELNAFTPDEMRLLEELSGDLSFGIMVLRNRFERARAEEELRERERHSQSLLHLSRELEHSQTYAEVLNAAQDEVKTIIGYQNLWAYLLTEDKKFAKALFAGGPASDIVMSEEGAAMLAIEGDRMLEEIAAAKEIVLVEDAQTDERVNREIVLRLGNRTIVNVPIILKDRHMGSVGMGTFGEEGVRVPTGSEQKYLMALASHMAAALDRIHLLAERTRAEEEIRTLNVELEQRVMRRTAELREKNAELERMNRLFVGRELRMVELKEHIEELKRKLTAEGGPL
jgi:GAF domain-containing protein/PAS domain-containing protein